MKSIFDFLPAKAPISGSFPGSVYLTKVMMERCLWRNEDTHVDVGENESNGLPPNSSGMRSLRNMFWCDYFLHLTLHLFIFKYFMKKLYL